MALLCIWWQRLPPPLESIAWQVWKRKEWLGWKVPGSLTIVLDKDNYLFVLSSLHQACFANLQQTRFASEGGDSALLVRHKFASSLTRQVCHNKILSPFRDRKDNVIDYNPHETIEETPPVLLQQSSTLSTSIDKTTLKQSLKKCKFRLVDPKTFHNEPSSALCITSSGGFPHRC
ncbi:hypothetical protein AVEN_56057-1 [Araneus ventricosus]|uniref:Uncharacterized protein n=1 Tax=Araneus ventricosus TaxID=182803 RepID=A0A4Y2SUF8_ARAVE|nr:hypothetical protein AVEN_56057-1 [Araneus ventricosus]